MKTLALREEIARSSMSEEIVVPQASFAKLCRRYQRLRRLNPRFLILGETGTGKELIAERFISDLSVRRERSSG